MPLMSINIEKHLNSLAEGKMLEDFEEDIEPYIRKFTEAKDFFNENIDIARAVTSYEKLPPVDMLEELHKNKDDYSIMHTDTHVMIGLKNTSCIMAISRHVNTIETNPCIGELDQNATFKNLMLAGYLRNAFALLQRVSYD